MTEIMEVTLQGLFRNNIVTINRWNYTGDGTPVAPSDRAFSLLSALGMIPSAGVAPSGTLLQLVTAMVHPDLVFTQAICLNPYDPTDFYDAAFAPVVPGLNSGGASLSPASAFGFVTTVIRRDIARGTKRFPGIQKDSSDAGGIISSAGLALMDDVVTAMNATVTHTIGAVTFTFVPVIAGKEKYVVPGSSPVRYAYRYHKETGVPATDKATQLAATAGPTIWQRYNTVRTQTSRQYGRGA